MPCTAVQEAERKTYWLEWLDRQAFPDDRKLDPSSVRDQLSNIELKEIDISVDSAGNIVKMPLVAVRPCFGDIITLYRDHEPPKNRNYPGYTKCTRCKALNACSEVVAARVGCTPAIDRAFSDCTISSVVRLRNGARYATLVDAIKTRGRFASVNDDFDADNRAAELAWKAIQKERQYQADLVRRRQRRAELAERGEIENDLMVALVDQRDARAAVLRANSGPGCGADHSLRFLDQRSVDHIADTWLAAVVTSIQAKGRSNANRMANWLVEVGRGGFSSRTSAYARVSKDLPRLHQLHDPAGPWSGRPSLVFLDVPGALRTAITKHTGSF